MSALVLVVRKMVRAESRRVFDAWTEADQLLKWWGPKSVTCIAAEIDLRVGGQFRIANQFPDDTVVWISGQFEVIERPTCLVYSWRIGSETSATERVTVRFVAHLAATEVIVTHERITTAAVRDQHELGWVDCLAGLARHLQGGEN